MNRVRQPLFLMVAAAAILVLAGLVVFRLSSIGAKGDARQGRVITVGTTLPIRGDLDVRLSYTADIQPNQQVNLFSRVDGYIAKIHVDKGDFVKAEQMAHKAIGIKPDARDAYFLLGKIHAARQEWKDAEADFKKVISLDPEKEEEGDVALASVYVDSKRPQEAVGLLEKFAEQNPGSMFGF